MKYFCVIYTYTTALRTPKGRVKVGSARRKASTAFEAARVRIAEQSTAISADDPAQILEVFDVSDICETGKKHGSLSNLRTLEQTFLHKKMKDKGMWYAGEEEVDVKDTSEWFFGNTPNHVVNEVKILLNEKRYGISRPNSFPPRQEQQEFEDQAIAYYQNGGNKFLGNDKMRFGKTFASLRVAKRLKCKNVLIITYKPAVETSWREECEQHVDFENFKFVSAKDFSNSNPIALKKGSDNILFTSFQDFNDFEKDKWKIAKKYHFDLIIRDECHYGTRTDKAQASIDILSYDKMLDLSGTPLKLLMSGEYLPEQTHYWGYVDEQKKKQTEIDSGLGTEIYKWLPTLKFYTYEISQEAKDQSIFYEDHEEFSMTKMFGSNDGESFVDQAAVNIFVDNHFGIGIHKNKSPYRNVQVDHEVWFMPNSVKSCNAMEKLLKSKQHLHNAHIINVAGNGITNINKVKQEQKRFAKTITLSCGRFNTGVTVPRWWHVVMMNDNKSPQDYMQTIFRGQSSEKAYYKDICYVTDYNPKRMFEMLYEYTYYTAKPNQSATDSLREFMDFAPLIDNSNNKPREILVEEILDHISVSGINEKNFGSSVIFDWNNSKLDNYNIEVDELMDSKHKSTAWDFSNAKGTGKNYKVTSKGGNQSNDNTDKLEETKKRLAFRTAMSMLPKYLFVEDTKISCVDDIICKGNSEIFELYTMMSIDMFNEMITDKVVHKDRLDRCIMSYNNLTA